MNAGREPEDKRPSINEQGSEATDNQETDERLTDAAQTSDDELEFVATESREASPEFVGGQRAFGAAQDDDLGIESPSDLIDREALTSTGEPRGSNPSAGEPNRPIGESAPPPPPPAADIPLDDDRLAESGPEQYKEEFEEAQRTGKLKKLSDDELKAIEQNLYGRDSYLSNREKDDLIKNIDSNDKPFSNTPIAPPKSQGESPADRDAAAEPSLDDKDLLAPTMAKRGKGVACFRNFIQLAGTQELLEDDEMSINGREYVLKPKKIKPAVSIGAGAALFTLLLFIIGSFFVGDTDSEGAIAGVVLDEYDQPYIRGAEIRLPESGHRVVSNAQGFFKTESLPSGTHRIEYVVDGRLVAAEFATVVSGELSLIFLRPSEEDAAEMTVEPQTRNESAEVREAPSAEPTTPKATQEIARATKSSGSTPTGKASSSKQSSSKSSGTSSGKKSTSPGKIVLKANVEGARFSLNGSVLGAGNLTYSKIKPGTHTYLVKADGYQPEEGTIKLSSGETKVLSVGLSPLQQTAKEETYGAEEFFFSGKNALASGDFDTAIEDLTEVIERSPSNAEAFAQRAEGYKGLKDVDKACLDYIQAGEMFHMKKEYGRAISCFEKSLDLDPKRIGAMLGRASVYLSKGEELAAITDFEQVLRLDKRNFQAYYGMGRARFKQEQYSKAIRHFKDARSINDKDPLVHHYLILSYMADDDYKNVKKVFEKFTKVASETQVEKFVSDPNHAAIVRVVEGN